MLIPTSIRVKCNIFTIRYNLAVKGYTTDDQTVTNIANAVQMELSGQYGYNLWTSDQLINFCIEKKFPIKSIDRP